MFIPCNSTFFEKFIHFQDFNNFKWVSPLLANPALTSLVNASDKFQTEDWTFLSLSEFKLILNVKVIICDLPIFYMFPNPSTFCRGIFHKLGLQHVFIHCIRGSLMFSHIKSQN